jgi:uncharacterized membrane protein YqaE (UPF0057 family)
MAFTSILTPVIIIGLVAITLGDLLWKIVTSFPDILQLLKNLTDPEIFMRDITYGIFTGIQMIIMSSMDLFKGILLKIADKLGFSDDFFGLKTDKNRGDQLEQNLQKIQCVKPTFIKYIILVICPPLYVFMVKGLNGWMYIILDIIFTMLFYFPGLLYALLICKTC